MGNMGMYSWDIIGNRLSLLNGRHAVAIEVVKNSKNSNANLHANLAIFDYGTPAMVLPFESIQLAASFAQRYVFHSESKEEVGKAYKSINIEEAKKNIQTHLWNTEWTAAGNGLFYDDGYLFIAIQPHLDKNVIKGLLRVFNSGDNTRNREYTSHKFNTMGEAFGFVNTHIIQNSHLLSLEDVKDIYNKLESEYKNLDKLQETHKR